MINLPAIFIANGTAVILLMILLLSANRNTRYGLLDDKIFYAMVTFTILQCVIESSVFYIDGKDIEGYRQISLILNAGLYANNILVSFLWTVYADYKLFEDTRRIRKIYPFVAIPAVGICIGGIVNLFTPVFFRISEDNVYERTAFYVIPYIFTYLYLLYGVLIIYLYRNKVKKYLFLPAILFMIPIFIGSLIQYYCYGISLVWIGVAVALMSLYINVQNETSSIDTLSGLFNRQYLNSYLNAVAKKSNAAGRMAGIMLDIDQFKRINDQFGHLVGDDAIRTAGHILHEAVPDSLVARYAGDEFLVLKHVKDKAEITQSMEKIKNVTERVNATENNPYKIYFSMGESIFQGENDTIDAFLGRMDEKMYEDKKSKIVTCDRRHDRRL